MTKLGPLLIFPSAADKASATGRPSLRTPETVAKMCAAIREAGHTDTHAAALAGVSSSAVSRWRQEDEEFAVHLDAARAEYLDGRLKEIRETRKRDGSLDWRAQAWLMQAAAPEVYGAPSRRHSLAREKEEKKRAEEKAEADDPNVLSKADLGRFHKWRRYSIEKMNGVGEEEARWLGHFTHEANPPVFPGSLALAGAEIAPEREYTPEEEAQWAAIHERRRVAHAAIEKQERERREMLAARDELVEGEGELEAMGHEATQGGGDDANESGRPRAEFQNATNLPETRDGAADGGATRGGGARTPWGGTTPDGGTAPARQAGGGRDANRANIPESPAGGGWRAAAGERLANREMGVPSSAARTPRPLTGAARAAVEAKEWRRMNRLVEEQWERSADRAMAAAENASRDAIPGMWAGF